MTTVHQPVADPFALLMDPEAVFAAIARSDRLARLQSRICRPLDKIPGAPVEEVGTESPADSANLGEDPDVPASFG